MLKTMRKKFWGYVETKLTVRSKDYFSGRELNRFASRFETQRVLAALREEFKHRAEE